MLNLSPYGRSQVAEHVDWGVWMAFQAIDIDDRPISSPQIFNANDYNLLISMVLTHQGIALGWNHLVTRLVEQGLLVRAIINWLIGPVVAPIHIRMIHPRPES
jgi:DNA-binding transcriptional LysR family regulator